MTIRSKRRVGGGHLRHREGRSTEAERQVLPALVRWPSFDPSTPWILSDETGTLPRVRPSNNPILAQLAEQRAAALSEATSIGVAAFHRLPDGTEVTAVIRRAYADGVRRFAAGNAAEPPNPFAGDSTESFLSWLADDDGPDRILHALFVGN